MLCFECQSPNSEGRVFYVQGSWNCPTCNLYVPRKALSLFHCFSVSLSSILCSVGLFLSIISRGIGISVSRTVLLSLVIETLSFFRDRDIICHWISIS